MKLLVVLRFLLFAAIAVLVLVAARANTASAHRSAVSVCGLERWTVKTLQDRPRLLPVRPTTVAALTSLSAPASLPDTRLPFERRVFRTVAQVVLIRPEADRDLHLVLRDGGQTMIAEAPDPPCAPAATALRRRQMTAVRPLVPCGGCWCCLLRLSAWTDRCCTQRHRTAPDPRLPLPRLRWPGKTSRQRWLVACAPPAGAVDGEKGVYGAERQAVYGWQRMRRKNASLPTTAMSSQPSAPRSVQCLVLADRLPRRFSIRTSNLSAGGSHRPARSSTLVARFGSGPSGRGDSTTAMPSSRAFANAARNGDSASTMSASGSDCWGPTLI